MECLISCCQLDTIKCKRILDLEVLPTCVSANSYEKPVSDSMPMSTDQSHPAPGASCETLVFMATEYSNPDAGRWKYLSSKDRSGQNLRNHQQTPSLPILPKAFLTLKARSKQHVTFSFRASKEKLSSSRDEFSQSQQLLFTGTSSCSAPVSNFMIQIDPPHILSVNNSKADYSTPRTGKVSVHHQCTITGIRPLHGP
ncbi:hypothetical protein AVEN_171453-1 [Araneus ventricosus]|uniref:Uncharacterized protein n=1 Tax=Araneus ventricosus TaxID=182803 RepID=A0A4Y2QBY1_ARAVE|nr:hypothetical protein AVEN_171453-1 [Araneus ventricosus]